MGRFDPLSDLDFEELVADLLRADTGLPFRAGVRGRDRGIDVLAVRRRRRHVGQCKHIRTGQASAAVREAKKEAAQLARRRPRWASYRFITSARLSHDRRAEIEAILRPWIKDVDQVLGEGDLIRLLREHPEVEARHVKLWLASAGSLRRALHAGAYERSEALLEETRAALPRYVQTEAFLEARAILHDHGVVVISGPPGVGKTTLARLLTLDGLEQGYQPYDIPQGGLTEAWDLVTPRELQLFFYDDFLGRISLSPGQEDDEMLIRFMRRVSRSKTTRMVLTTREYILRQAQRLSEVLDRESSNVHRYLLQVHRYGRREKARIFYNHIYFSDQVDSTARRSLLEERGYRRIIDHRNYNPRLIEWMTGLAGEGLDQEARQNYTDYCLGVLSNPERLWERAFERGLSEADQVVLLCMASLPYGSTLSALETGFIAACKARDIRAHQREYMASLKVLADSFLSTQEYEDVTIVLPQNPSLLDFLADYVRSSRADAERVLEGAIYLDQVLGMWTILSGPMHRRRSRPTPPRHELMPAFSRAFERTIDSPLPAEGHHPLRGAAASALDSPLGRLDLLIDHLEQAPALAQAVSRDWLIAYAEDWISGQLVHQPSSAGLKLVRRLVEHGVLDGTAVAVIARPAILVMPPGTPRWECIGYLHELAPATFGTEEWSALQEEILAEIDARLYEAAAYFEEVSELEDFAGAADLMGVEIDDSLYVSALEDVEIAVSEREGDHSGYEPDDGSDDFRGLRGGGEDDADIDAMFDRLLE